MTDTAYFHRRLSCNHIFFYLFSLYFTRFLPGFAPALCNLEANSQPQCCKALETNPETWARSSLPAETCCSRDPRDLHRRAALPGCWAREHQVQGTGEYLVILGMKSSFIFTCAERFAQPALLLYITHVGSDRRQERKQVVKSQKFSQPIQIWVSRERSI